MEPKLFNFRSWQKIYEGRYDFQMEGVSYSEENFVVYTNPDNMDVAFVSNSMTRAPNGEFLKISVNHLYTNEFFPKLMMVHRSLGVKFSTEIYSYQKQESKLYYDYTNNHGDNHLEEIDVSNKFHVETPDVLTSLLFTLYKKQPAGTTVSQKVIFSNNLWTYEQPLVQKEILLARGAKGMNEEIFVGKNKLSASKYTIFENEEHEKKREGTGIIFYLSKHFSIPYQVSTGIENHKIEIEFLKDLRENDVTIL